MSRRVPPTPTPLPPLNAAFGATNVARANVEGMAAVLWDMEVSMGEDDSRTAALGLLRHVLTETAAQLATVAEHISDELRRREVPPAAPERTARR
jgi:hypothetical protein